MDPIVISRPKVTIMLKKEDNRHLDPADEDLVVDCTVAAGQEETYLGMDLSKLQELQGEEIDNLRESLVDRKFECTLAINRFRNVILRLVDSFPNDK